MNGLTKLVPPCLGLLLLAACGILDTGTELQEAERVSPQGSDFNKSWPPTPTLHLLLEADNPT